ncbi:MAG TPA: hypothetical protein VN426_09565 [Syntrophomonadaceae bacterium]|nr:hypothetical protein [Syntrophomonadaceae bacterium]
MDKLKCAVACAIYISSIILISIMGDKFNDYLLVLHSTYFESSYLWFLPIYPILIGFLIALPQFIRTIRKTGAWHFQWIKFLIMGIPALYIAFTYNIYFGRFGDLLPVIHSRQLYIIGGIIFGNVLFTSIYKQSTPDVPRDAASN